MANYNIVVDTSNFKPFTYKDLMAPYYDYAKDYDKQQEVNDKIAQTLGNLKSAIEASPEDSKARQIYESYYNDFNNAVSDFAKGMTSQNALELSRLRNRYGTEIIQLGKAQEAMAAVAKARRDNKDNSMLYQNIGTLDNYLADPTYNPRSYSGKELEKEVGELTKAVANGIVNLVYDGKLDSFTERIIKTRGFTPAEIARAAASIRNGETPVNNTVLQTIVQDVLKSSGVYEWGDADTQQRAMNHAIRGLYQGVLGSDMSMHTDEKAKMNYQAALAEAADIRKTQRELAKAEITSRLKSGNGGSGVPVNFDEVSMGSTTVDTANKAVKNIYTALGLSENGTGLRNTPLRVKIEGADAMGNPNLVELHPKNGGRFNLFNKDGRLLSEQEFAEQGEAADKQQLREYYRSKIVAGLQTLGLSPIKKVKGGDGYEAVNITINDVEKAANNYKKQNGATYINTVSMNYGNNYNMFKNRVGSIVSNAGGAYHITNGTQDFTAQKKVSLSEITEKIGNDTSNNPISYNLSLAQGKQGLIISIGDDRYFIPKENMGSIAREGWDVDVQLLQQARANYQALLDRADDFISTYGEEQYARLLREAEQACDNAGEASIRKIATGIFGTYKDPEFKLVNQ